MVAADSNVTFHKKMLKIFGNHNYNLRKITIIYYSISMFLRNTIFHREEIQLPS